MSAFGENLRREREMRGVSLEEISTATKISLRFLEAIEREDFGKLPGGIFSRSFIRSYARYLGLDEERVVAEFQLAARPQAEFDLHRLPAGNATSSRPVRRTPLIATLVAVVLLAVGYVLYRYSPRGVESSTPPPPVTAAPAKPPAPPVTQPAQGTGEAAPPTNTNPAAGGVAPASAPGASPATLPGAPTNPPTTPKPSASSPAPSGTSPTANPPAVRPAFESELVLQVAATDRAWVAIDADGKTVLQRVLEPNEVETLKAHNSFDVTTGNAQAVILTLNGETLKPLGRHGEVKTLHLSREDVKNSAP